MTELLTIQHKTFSVAPAARVYDILTTAAGWGSRFTRGRVNEARNGGELPLRWAGARRASSRDAVRRRARPD